MKKINKIVAALVTVCFIFNTIASDYVFALGISPASTRPDARAAINSAAIEAFAIRHPRSDLVADVDKAIESIFVGGSPEIAGVNIERCDNDSTTKDLIEVAGLVFPKGLAIEERDLGPADNGTFPVWHKDKISNTLTFNTTFRRMHEHIRKNNVKIAYSIHGAGVTTSLADAILYRVIRGEFGTYSDIDKAVWVWFSSSYLCPNEGVRRDNNIYEKTLRRFIGEEGANLGINKDNSEAVIKLALAINYHFFKDRPGAKIPQFTSKPHIEKREEMPGSQGEGRETVREMLAGGLATPDVSTREGDELSEGIRLGRESFDRLFDIYSKKAAKLAEIEQKEGKGGYKSLKIKNEVMLALENLRMDSEAVRIKSLSDLRTGDVVLELGSKAVHIYDGSAASLGGKMPENSVALRPLTMTAAQRVYRDALIKIIRNFDRKNGRAARLGVLRQLNAMIESGIIPQPVMTDDIFMHCHSDYSHSPGHSVEYIAWKGKMLGLKATGLVDHDTVGGVEEFLEAAAIIHLPNPSCGNEKRGYFEGTPFEHMTTNSPNNIAETYVAFHAVTRSRDSESEKRIIAAKVERFKKVLGFINSFKILPAQLDYATDIAPLTGAGNPTEKHVAEAIAKAICGHYGCDLNTNLDKFITCANSLIAACDAAGGTKTKPIELSELQGVDDPFVFTNLIRNRVVTVIKWLKNNDWDLRPTKKEIAPIADLVREARENGEEAWALYLGGKEPCQAEDRTPLTKEERLQKLAEWKAKGWGEFDQEIVKWWLELEKASVLHLCLRYLKVTVGMYGVMFMPNRDSEEEIAEFMEIAKVAGFGHIANGMDVNSEMPFTYFSWSNIPVLAKEAMAIVEHEKSKRGSNAGSASGARKADGTFAAKPGKSPADLERLIQKYTKSGEHLSAPMLLELYTEHWKEMGFERPARVRKHALKTVQRDLYSGPKSLMKQLKLVELHHRGPKGEKLFVYAMANTDNKAITIAANPAPSVIAQNRRIRSILSIIGSEIAYFARYASVLMMAFSAFIFNAKNILADTFGVPAQPTVVTTKAGDRRIFVQERNQDGSLGSPYALTIKGVTWSPTSIGTDRTDFPAARAEYIKWYTNDVAQMARMGANAVQFFYMDMGTNADIRAMLDEFWRQGLKVMIPPYSYFNLGRTNSIPELVNSLKDHPAILMWIIGDGWDRNLYAWYNGTNVYREGFTNLIDAAAFTEQAAQLVKSIDPNHPVATSFGDLNYPPYNEYLTNKYHYLDRDIAPWSTGPFTSDIVSNLVPSVDIWGIDLYVNDSFMSRIAEWAKISGKPMFLIGEGPDSYDHRIPGENREMQRSAYNSLWQEVFYNLAAERTNGIVSGMSVYGWNDEWDSESDRDPWIQNISTNIRSSTQPDGYVDGEWSGIVKIDRTPKLAYYGLQDRFSLGGEAFVPVVTNPVVTVTSAYWYVTFSIDGRTVYNRYGNDFGARGFNVAVLDENSGVRTKDTRHFDTAVDVNAHRALQDYLNGLPDGSIVLISTCDYSGMGQSGAQDTKNLLMGPAWGSTMIGGVTNLDDNWAMIAKKGFGKLDEKKGAGYSTITVQAQPDLTATIDANAGRRQAVVPVESPVIEGVKQENGNFEVVFKSQGAFVYQIEYCDDLTIGGWKVARRGIVADGADTKWIDDGSFTGGTAAEKRFYRIKVVDRVTRPEGVSMGVTGLHNGDTQVPPTDELYEEVIKCLDRGGEGYFYICDWLNQLWYKDGDAAIETCKAILDSPKCYGFIASPAFNEVCKKNPEILYIFVDRIRQMFEKIGAGVDSHPAHRLMELTDNFMDQDPEESLKNVEALISLVAVSMVVRNTMITIAYVDGDNISALQNIVRDAVVDDIEDNPAVLEAHGELAEEILMQAGSARYAALVGVTGPHNGDTLVPETALLYRETSKSLHQEDKFGIICDWLNQIWGKDMNGVGEIRRAILDSANREKFLSSNNLRALIDARPGIRRFVLTCDIAGTFTDVDIRHLINLYANPKSAASFLGRAGNKNALAINYWAALAKLENALKTHRLFVEKSALKRIFFGRDLLPDINGIGGIGFLDEALNAVLTKAPVSSKRFASGDELFTPVAARAMVNNGNFNRAMVALEACLHDINNAADAEAREVLGSDLYAICADMARSPRANEFLKFIDLFLPSESREQLMDDYWLDVEARENDTLPEALGKARIEVSKEIKHYLDQDPLAREYLREAGRLEKDMPWATNLLSYYHSSLEKSESPKDTIAFRMVVALLLLSDDRTYSAGAKWIALKEFSGGRMDGAFWTNYFTDIAKTVRGESGTRIGMHLGSLVNMVESIKIESADRFASEAVSAAARHAERHGAEMDFPEDMFSAPSDEAAKDKLVSDIQDSVAKTWSALSERERTLIRLRNEGLSFEEIGLSHDIHVSKERARILLIRAEKKLWSGVVAEMFSKGYSESEILPLSSLIYDAKVRREATLYFTSSATETGSVPEFVADVTTPMTSREAEEAAGEVEMARQATLDLVAAEAANRPPMGGGMSPEGLAAFAESERGTPELLASYIRDTGLTRQLPIIRKALESDKGKLSAFERLLQTGKPNTVDNNILARLDVLAKGINAGGDNGQAAVASVRSIARNHQSGEIGARAYLILLNAGIDVVYMRGKLREMRPFVKDATLLAALDAALGSGQASAKAGQPQAAAARHAERHGAEMDFDESAAQPDGIRKLEGGEKVAALKEICATLENTGAAKRAAELRSHPDSCTVAVISKGAYTGNYLVVDAATGFHDYVKIMKTMDESVGLGPINGEESVIRALTALAAERPVHRVLTDFILTLNSEALDKESVRRIFRAVLATKHTPSALKTARVMIGGAALKGTIPFTANRKLRREILSILSEEIARRRQEILGSVPKTVESRAVPEIPSKPAAVRPKTGEELTRLQGLLGKPVKVEEAGPTASGGQAVTVEIAGKWMDEGGIGFVDVLQALKVMAINDVFDTAILNRIVTHTSYGSFLQYFLSARNGASTNLEQAILKKVEDALRSAPAEELWADELAARKLVSNIADFTVKYAPDYRPGSENEKKILAPNSPTLENIHKLIGILPNIKVRVLVSSSVGLDETVRRTLAKIRQERGKDSLYSDVFDQSNLGILLAACQKEDGVKTIIVSDASSAGYIEALVKAQPQLFKGVRSFNAVLPQDYSGFRREEKRVYQADVVFKAMVARLADKNGNPFVLDLLKELLDRRLDKGVTFENFIDGITESDNEAVDMGKIVARITNCLKMNVSLVEKIGEQLIILRHFIWTAA